MQLNFSPLSLSGSQIVLLQGRIVSVNSLAVADVDPAGFALSLHQTWTERFNRFFFSYQSMLPDWVVWFIGISWQHRLIWLSFFLGGFYALGQTLKCYLARNHCCNRATLISMREIKRWSANIRIYILHMSSERALCMASRKSPLMTLGRNSRSCMTSVHSLSKSLFLTRTKLLSPTSYIHKWK